MKSGQAQATHSTDDAGHPPQAIVMADGVCRTFGHGHTAVHALRGVSFTIGRGQLVALRGRSGSGKTTLLNIIGGLRLRNRVELQQEPDHIGVWPAEADTAKADTAEADTAEADTGQAADSGRR